MKILYLTKKRIDFDAITPLNSTYDVKRVSIPQYLLKIGVVFKSYLNIKGLDLDYDVIHAIVDRPKGQDLRGRHSRIGNKSYCRSWVGDKDVSFRDGDDTANDTRNGDMKQKIYTPLHENYHAKSDHVGKEDKLHEWVALGKFNKYDKEYLTSKYPDDLLPLVNRKWKALKFLMSFKDPIVLVEGARGCKLQNKYKREGKSNAGCGESMHQYGIAIDFRFKNEPHWPDPNTSEGKKRWERCLKVAQWLGFFSYGLEYDWDYGHIQLMLDYESEKDIIKNIDYSKYE